MFYLEARVTIMNVIISVKRCSMKTLYLTRGVLSGIDQRCFLIFS